MKGDSKANGLKSKLKKLGQLTATSLQKMQLFAEMAYTYLLKLFFFLKNPFEDGADSHTALTIGKQSIRFMRQQYS